jgi:hypothetical protein
MASQASAAMARALQAAASVVALLALLPAALLGALLGERGAAVLGVAGSWAGLAQGAAVALAALLRLFASREGWRTLVYGGAAAETSPPPPPAAVASKGAAAVAPSLPELARFVRQRRRDLADRLRAYLQPKRAPSGAAPASPGSARSVASFPVSAAAQFQTSSIFSRAPPYHRSPPPRRARLTRWTASAQHRASSRPSAPTRSTSRARPSTPRAEARVYSPLL